MLEHCCQDELFEDTQHLSHKTSPRPGRRACENVGDYILTGGTLYYAAAHDSWIDWKYGVRNWYKYFPNWYFSSIYIHSKNVSLT